MKSETTGSWGVWHDAEERVRGNLRKGEAGIFLEEILPHSARGDGFGDFDISGYLSYALFWFVTHEQYSAAVREAKQNQASATSGQPVSLKMPPLDLELYGLLDEDGVTDYDCVKDLYGIIAILWNDGDVVQPVPGVMHQVWTSGKYNVVEAATSLMMCSRADNSALRSVELSDILLRVYKDVEDIAPGQLFSFEEATTLVNRWATSVRRHPELRNDEACQRDYMELGIIRHGGYDPVQIERIWRFILKQSEPPNFAQTYAFAKPFMDQKNTTEQAKVKKALKSRKAERKRKKLGRKRR